MSEDNCIVAVILLEYWWDSFRVESCLKSGYLFPVLLEGVGLPGHKFLRGTYKRTCQCFDMNLLGQKCIGLHES